MFGNLAKVREKFSKSKGKVQDIVRPFPDFVLGGGGGGQQFVLDPSSRRTNDLGIILSWGV